MIIAIDGPAASGKSTVGALLAERLGLLMVDSGLLYRGLAWLAHERGIPLGDADLDGQGERALISLAEEAGLRIDGDRLWAGGRDLTPYLRRDELGVILPLVSRVPQVRTVVVRSLRRMRETAPPAGLVMVGRDIGTVVFPDADHKFFLDASPGERMRRRGLQEGIGGDPDRAESLRLHVLERDRQDRQREVAPLQPAADAVVIDTGGRDPEQVVELMLERIRSGGR